MLQIRNFIFSSDILEKRFCCDLPGCLGSCCRYGDSGAPITEEETKILDNIWPFIKPYLRPEGVQEIEKNGTSVRDFENDTVTPLINNAECAYTIMSGNIFMCAIEKAWSDGKVSFRKPLSCHLFPVRIRQFSGFKAVNYEELRICSPAREKGKTELIYLYEFLKDPLIRALGQEVYDELCIAADEFRQTGGPEL
jgi:hypothetical protein